MCISNFIKKGNMKLNSVAEQTLLTFGTTLAPLANFQADLERFDVR